MLVLQNFFQRIVMQKKARYVDIVVPIILAYLLPIIFMFIIFYSLEAFAPETFRTLERSKNVIIANFITMEYVALLAIPLFLSLVLSIFIRNVQIFIGVPMIIYTLLPFVIDMTNAVDAIVVNLISIFVFLPTIMFNYFVLRIFFVNFPKIKKIAYTLTALFPMLFIMIAFLDKYRYEIDGKIFGTIEIIFRFAGISILAGPFIILIIAYVYYWKARGKYIMPEEYTNF